MSGREKASRTEGAKVDYWIFVATNHKIDGRILTGDQIFRQRMADEFWGVGEKTPNRSSLRKGDQVVFYTGFPSKVFVGTAILGSDSYRLSQEEQDHVSHGKKFYKAEFGVRLEQIQVWSKSRSIESVLPQLKFIENKEFWGTYFQGGVRQISEEDFRTITLDSQVAVSLTQSSVEDLQSKSEFALEGHLEEFIDRNWDSIDFGIKLVRYRTDEQTGRQFPAGPWSIDFLCTEVGTGDFVILELKRGKTSDSTVGQVLRYIGWVKANLAKSGRNVRGIIVARGVDEALRYAVQDVESVSVLTYKVDFMLSPFQK